MANRARGDASSPLGRHDLERRSRTLSDLTTVDPWQMRLKALPYAIATFLGAFLVFQVQPIISKCVLPWFGGTPAVWTTCMLFFQMLLLGGYLYAHLLRTYLSLVQQAVVHVGLLLLAMFALPIEPSTDWKPEGDASPIVHLLLLLLAHVGLPYFVLSSTGPLMQAWMSTRVTSDRIYRLYALSNVGSLLALLSYPFVVELTLSVSAQSNVWSALFAVFVTVQAMVAGLLIWRSKKPASQSSAAEPMTSTKVPFGSKAAWVSLAALASTLLLTTTNHVCQDVAVIPFFWILPLSLYLISFIICFDSPKLYHPKLFAGLALAMLATILLATKLAPAPRLVLDAIASVLFLFFVCILCHGEVARLKPSVKHLTLYYTLLSAGGALGGLIVAVACPVILNDYSEQPIVNTLGASLSIVLFFTVRNWFGREYDWRSIRQLRIAAIALPLFSTGAAASYSLPGLIESDRNFFGVVRVEEKVGDRCLVHGSTVHGLQRKSPYESEPTTYYGHESGIGRTLLAHGADRTLNVCGIGLGCGVLASYGRSGDHYDFVEINPAVIRMATQYFTFISHSEAKIDQHLGDGRLILERMNHRRFDVIALDAFSSDSIPAHLLTREAFALYRERLSDDGIIAVHVSNKHLDLAPLVHRLAANAGMMSKLVVSAGNTEAQTLPALWMVVADHSHSIWTDPRLSDAVNRDDQTLHTAPLWTDQHHNLLSVFRALP